jgi:3-hydroxybutyryl-CoA dehydrogenase
MSNTIVAPTVKQIAVIGSGTMGSGIAQVAAIAGYDVFMHDIDLKFVEKAKNSITGSLDKFVSKQKMTQQDRDLTLARLKPSSDLSNLKDADIIIEAISEKLELKIDLFRKLDEICKPETILASNTSSLSVTDMAAATKRPSKVVGMHFFNPAALMKLVEVIRTPMTSAETFTTAWEVVLKMGKSPVETRDTPGFIFNRLIIPYLNEAMWAVYEGAGLTADIDAAMKLGGNMPIGPLALIDMIGVDVQLHACEALHNQFQDPKFRPCPLNKQMARAGYLGRKSGKGFYDYSSDPAVPVDLAPFRLS